MQKEGFVEKHNRPLVSGWNWGTEREVVCPKGMAEQPFGHEAGILRRQM